MASASILLRHLVCALLSVLALSKGSCDVSMEDYLEMERYLRFINKPAVKIIQTKDGDIFACVDIYKQPAMDHPSLQNHTIQVDCDDCEPQDTSFELPDGGCPPQTVPIRRVQMEDLLRAGSVSKYLSKGAAGPEHKYAILRTNGKYKGMDVTLSLWNPKFPKAEDFSLSQFWLGAHSGPQTSTMEAGWQVYPRFARTNKSRLFTFWTPDNYKTGCYNHDCPGFVQVSSTISPGMVLEPVSTIGGVMRDIRFTVDKDTKTGNWQLKFGQSRHYIGYWPSRLFKYGFSLTDRVTWGGETVSSTIYPPMGSGRFAKEGQGKAAYVKNIKLHDPAGKIVDVNKVSIYQCAACYTLSDRGNAADGSGRHFFYGGPGGKTCPCVWTHASDVLRQVA